MARLMGWYNHGHVAAVAVLLSLDASMLCGALEPCKGLPAGDVGGTTCADMNSTVCAFRFYRGLGANVQCGHSGFNCLAVGPICAGPGDGAEPGPASCAETPLEGNPEAFEDSSKAGDFGGDGFVSMRGSQPMCADSDKEIDDRNYVFYFHATAVGDDPYKLGVATDQCCESLECCGKSGSECCNYQQGAATIYQEPYTITSYASTSYSEADKMKYKFDEGWPLGYWQSWGLGGREAWYGSENVNKTIKALVKCHQTSLMRPSVVFSEPGVYDFLAEVSWPARSESTTWDAIYPYAMFRSPHQVIFSDVVSMPRTEVAGMKLAWVLNTFDGSRKAWRSGSACLSDCNSRGEIAFWKDCTSDLKSSDSGWTEDFKTEAFCEPIGEWVKIVAWEILSDGTKGEELAYAVYPVLKFMKGWSFKELFNLGREKVFTSKKSNVLSKNSLLSPLTNDRKLGGKATNTDPFFDMTSALRVNHRAGARLTVEDQDMGENPYGMGISLTGGYACEMEATSICRWHSSGRSGCYGTTHSCRNYATYTNALRVGYAVYIGGELSDIE